MSHSKSKKWTDQEVDRTVSLVVAGYSIESIMEKLNRTYHSVSCKISELRSNGIILPKVPRTSKKLRYETDHVDRNGPLLSSGAQEVTEPLTSPVTFASTSKLKVPSSLASLMDTYGKKVIELRNDDFSILLSIQENGYSGTLTFKDGKITELSIL